MNKQFYSTEEAAAALDVSPSRVRQMIGDGTITAIKVGKVHLLTAEEVRRAQGRKTKPGPAPRKAEAPKRRRAA